MCLHPRGDYVADFVYAAGGKDQKVTADSSDSIYESKLRKEMLRILAENGDPDAVVLDIGGNIGLHTVFLANAGYKVHVFEPFKGNFDLLKCTVMSNPQLAKNVVLNNFGLSDVAAKTCIVSNPTNHGGSVIQGSGTENCTAENTVEVRRLDDYLLEHQIKPYLVKIDVEGYEYKALSPASTFFKENPPSHIFSEFVSKHFKEQGEAEAYLELFYQLGYNVKWNENVVKKGSEKYSALMKAEFADIHMYQ
ncbi:methyltransferase FkbM [Rhizoclosmatium globosum]|uniref:Methyltransferase FkbM n=1 Tax=Rhizoclosmatium globosum TaxID=329046 RepID=A0A1Y2BTX3_9FUNG|nr:methyltransferase FkbM [Rhizoclosmatium globosum]|eukprot:ORY38144.1 methyltransferase FkbM [Rhizoclosmatium globosum]